MVDLIKWASGTFCESNLVEARFVILKGGGHEKFLFILLAIFEPWVEYCSHNFFEIFAQRVPAENEVGFHS